MDDSDADQPAFSSTQQSGGLDDHKISRVLAGELETTALTATERAVWSERFLEKMSEPGPDEEAFFTDLRKSGKAVGLGAAGKIVYATINPWDNHET